jgi:dihydrofolate synthase/folylpolyglutamate synthase
MLFDEAVAYLLSLGHETLAMKLGLANTERLLEALGQPQEAFRKVQIAGTNGKGSTAVMLDAILRAGAVRTALYTSPHLVSITERMRFDGQEVRPDDFARLATVVRDASVRLRDAGRIPALPTFFEQLTAMFLYACAGTGAELAILETGLGGRLDATTAARAEVVAITPIALDHQEYLGTTLAEVAAEKAAIIRPGVTVVVASQPPEALAVIERRCAECNVQPRFNDCAATVQGHEQDGRVRATFVTPRARYENILLGLRGRHQLINACVAIRLAETLYEESPAIGHNEIIAGLESARHAGRLEIYDRAAPRILFDGAHNVAGARALREFLDEYISARVTLVFGAMRDKDLAEIAAVLFPVARRLILTQPSNPRAATPEMLAAVVPPDVDMASVRLMPDLNAALEEALEHTPVEGLICVTGSLYLVGEAQGILHRQRLSGL